MLKFFLKQFINTNYHTKLPTNEKNELRSLIEKLKTRDKRVFMRSSNWRLYSYQGETSRKLISRLLLQNDFLIFDFFNNL